MTGVPELHEDASHACDHIGPAMALPNADHRSLVRSLSFPEVVMRVRHVRQPDSGIYRERAAAWRRLGGQEATTAIAAFFALLPAAVDVGISSRVAGTGQDRQRAGSVRRASPLMRQLEVDLPANKAIRGAPPSATEGAR